MAAPKPRRTPQEQAAYDAARQRAVYAAGNTKRQAERAERKAAIQVVLAQQTTAQ